MPEKIQPIFLASKYTCYILREFSLIFIFLLKVIMFSKIQL